MANREKRRLRAMQTAEREAFIREKLREANRQKAPRWARRFNPEEFAKKIGTRPLRKPVRFGPNAAELLAFVSRNRSRHLRELESWKPSYCYRYDRNIASLLWHTFGKYPLPPVFRNPRFDRNVSHLGWYVHLTQGGSIRKLPNSPIPLSRKIAFAFAQAPSGMEWTQALRWGQVIGMGGSRGLADAVIDTRLGSSFAQEKFWRRFLEFLVARPAVTRPQVELLVEYLHFMRYVMLPRRDEWGEYVGLGATAPDFSLRGRNLRSLLRLAERWTKTHAWYFEHRDRKYLFPRCNLGDHWLEAESGYYFFQQLSSPAELAEEAQAQYNCVYSYTQACRLGHSFIFSVRHYAEDLTSWRRVLTVEIKNNQVWQALGRQNTRPTAEQHAVLRRWCDLLGIRRRCGV